MAPDRLSEPRILPGLPRNEVEIERVAVGRSALLEALSEMPVDIPASALRLAELDPQRPPERKQGLEALVADLALALLGLIAHRRGARSDRVLDRL